MAYNDSSSPDLTAGDEFDKNYKTSSKPLRNTKRPTAVKFGCNAGLAVFYAQNKIPAPNQI
jgi:hypothetical protein